MLRLLLFIFAISITLSLPAQTTAWSLLEQGNAAYNQGRYAVAEKHYLSLLQQQPENAIAHYNLGLAYMQQDNVDAALQAFADAVRMTDDASLQAQAWHNIGVIREGQALVDQSRRGQLLRQAIEAYEESLRANPADDETRYNLALCQYQLRRDDTPPQDERKEQPQNQSQDQRDDQQDPTQQLLNLAQRAEDDTRQKIDEARKSPRQSDINW